MNKVIFARSITHSVIVIYLLSFLVITTSHVHAKQLTFNKSKQKPDVIFNYTWQDHQNQSKQVSFSLPLNQINKQKHKKFIPELAQQYVYIALHKAARKIDPKEARVQIHRMAKDINIQVTSRSQNLLDKWQRTMGQSREQALDQYLEDNYYSHFISHLGQKAVKPDHLRYVTENRQHLLPVAQALYEQVPKDSETRAYVNLVLSWVQGIPYNPLQDRLSSNGAGYLPPLSVVANNQGDCDSKSVLMASLVRSLLPDVKMIMLYLPNHALLGISLPFRVHEQTFEIDGTNYLLMEPTGPANMHLGEIAQRSSGDIAGGMYSFEVVP